MSDGLKRAVARRPDGSYVSLENPARQGERIVVYVTGLGRPVKASGSLVQTNQPGTPGDEASPPFLVSLRLGGADFWPASSLFATDSIGVYLVTFDVPAAAGGGNDVEFTVTALVGDQRIVSRASKLVVQ
jgi:uncharacterized protein (TIGR03437 family)